MAKRARHDGPIAYISRSMVKVLLTQNLKSRSHQSKKAYEKIKACKDEDELDDRNCHGFDFFFARFFTPRILVDCN